MYNGLLNNTVRTIKNAANVVAPKPDPFDMIAISLFSPERQQELRAQQERNQKIEDGLVAAATGAAVLGEIYQIIKNRKNK